MCIRDRRLTSGSLRPPGAGTLQTPLTRQDVQTQVEQQRGEGRGHSVGKLFFVALDARTLDSSPTAFVVQALDAGGPGGFGGGAGLREFGGSLQERDQAFDGILAVAFLGAVAAGVQDDDALGGGAAAGEAQGARPHRLLDAAVDRGGDALAGFVEQADGKMRRERRVERLLRASRLPASKTMEALQPGRFPKPLLQKVRELAKGDFLDRADNVLCFGLPGVGKSHVAAAIGHELVRRGRSVYYAPTYEVVQDLLAAKRDLMLPKALRRYDAFDLVVLDSC